MSKTMGTFARSANMAAQIVSGQDTSEDLANVVAASTLDLTKALYEGQILLIEQLGIEDDGGARSTFTGQPRSSQPQASGGNGSVRPMTDAQFAKTSAAIAKLGDQTPYTVDDLQAMSSDGGRDSERSAAIGKVFDAAYGSN